MCGPFLLSYAASWTRAASVVFRTAGDHARMPRVRLLVWCGVRCLPDGGGITPACPASVPSGAGARPGRPLRPAWHGRQGTTGPGDALMVGIPAARLYF